MKGMVLHTESERQEGQMWVVEDIWGATDDVHEEIGGAYDDAREDIWDAHNMLMN